MKILSVIFKIRWAVNQICETEPERELEPLEPRSKIRTGTGTGALVVPNWNRYPIQRTP